MGINKISKADIEEFQVETFHDNALDRYQQLATRSAIYPGRGTVFGLIYCALKGAGEAGEFAEHVGKALRDDALGFGLAMHHDGSTTNGNLLTDDRRQKLIKEVGDQLWYLAAKCNELGISLSFAATENLVKLADRSERGTLQGSGDDR